MTAVASPLPFQQINRPGWGTNGTQGGLNAMNPDDVAKMFMPRKSAQRPNSSSIVTNGTSSSMSITPSPSPSPNGVPNSAAGDLSWGGATTRKKVQRGGPWPLNKADPVAGVSVARPQSILATNGASAASTMSSIHQPSPIVPSQHIIQSPMQQLNGGRPAGEGNPVLYLISMNGTFERKTISVPFYPDSLRIGRQTNAKTVPTPLNGFFDSKVLSRQHAEIWADKTGKVWIRDVKSSNGTFVNGTRLSPENRDSEPHELQSQDHLELGIDIVSEDQKTVVHHKVAAKVEHAGFLGATNNVLDMSFGDLDPANAQMGLQAQQGVQLRGRSGSQGSVGGGSRIGTPNSVAGSQASSIMGQQQRPMNFWLTPVTTEQIVKRLTHEMRAARLQTLDLGRTEQFISTLMTKNDTTDAEKTHAPEPTKAPQVNGVLPAKLENIARFSEPPAPPPQQPLPEKPDSNRSHTEPPSPSPSLKRTTTERPRSQTSMSPIRQEPSSQIIALAEALASAKKEIDIQNARMRDLEEMLQKERQAREIAEEVAKRLEEESTKVASKDEGLSQGSLIEALSDKATELVTKAEEEIVPIAKEAELVDTNAIATSTALLEQRIESMLAEMQELKQHAEAFRKRAEIAESERDADRKTLAEMVEKIRAEELARRSSSTERASSPASSEKVANGTADGKSPFAPLLQKKAESNGKAISGKENIVSGLPDANMLTRHSKAKQSALLYQSTPYASMLGVVLIGMGLMAYLNGWQPPKADR
ncbi:cytoplasm to vacuole targeting protein-like protein Vps64 [Xylogone sp. PMI_703]|nr:cytoplasm to vacuole targeting protein-like protein Vps64 [Xylogone sp. PMI_703]